MLRPRRADGALVIAVALAFAGLFGIDLAIQNPGYLRDYRRNQNPDAVHYVLEGRNFWKEGVWSRQEGPPYAPDILRTPVYPVVAGGLDLAFRGAWAVYAFQSVCLAGTALAVYLLAFRPLGRPVALTAALLTAADLMLAVLSFEAMSETLFDLLAIVAILTWLRVSTVESADEDDRSWVSSPWAVGLLTGAAALTRPAAQFLPLVLGAAGVIVSPAGRRRSAIGRAVVLVASAALVVGPWVARNAIVFGVPRLTTTDTLTLLYFCGAGSYSVEHGVPLETAQKLIETEYGVAPCLVGHNPWMSGRSVKEIDAEQRRALPRVLSKYPSSLVLATAIGVTKSLFSHDVGTYAAMSGRRWTPPGLGNLLHGRLRTFGAHLAANPPILSALFAWETVLVVITASCGLLGAIVGLCVSRFRRPTAFLVVVAAYLVMTIGVAGLDAYSRHRAPVVPLLNLLAAVTLCSAMTWVRTWFFPWGLPRRDHESASVVGGEASFS